MCICPHCGQDTDRLDLNGSRPKPRKQTFRAWIKSLNGSVAIPADHHVWSYAERAGIPREFVELAWEAFGRKYAADTAVYIDWAGVFRKAVEGNWMRVWYVDGAGNYMLTSAARQLQRVLQSEARA